MSTELALVEAAELAAKEATPLRVAVDGLTVRDEAGYMEADGFVHRLTKSRKTIIAWFQPIVTAANLAHKTATAKRAEALLPLDEADRIVTTKMREWRVRDRAEKEAKAREDAERLRKVEEERQLRLAAEAEAQGDAALAEQIIEQPVTVAPVEPVPVKGDGVSWRTDWKWRVVDEDKIPRRYMVVDEKRIGGVVRALKADAQIPGIEVYSEEIPIRR